MKKTLAIILCAFLVALPFVSYGISENGSKNGEETGKTEVSNGAEQNGNGSVAEKQPLKLTGVKVNDGKQQFETMKNNDVKLEFSGEQDGETFKIVWAYKNWENWGVISDFSNVKEGKFNPKNIGKYDIYVDIKDKNGSIKTQKFTFVSDKGWTYVSVGVGKEMVINRQVNIVPDVTNGKDLQYKFVYCYGDDWKNWGVIQDFGPSASAKFVPKMIGKCTIYVDIKDKFGQSETKKMDSKVTYGWDVTSITGNNKITIDQNATITANTTGTNNALEYKFVYCYDNWKDWGVIQKFGQNNSATFIPPRSGRFDIYIDVKDAKGNMITEIYKVDVTSKWTFSDVGLSAGKMNVGETVTITPKVTGNKSRLKYKYVWCKDDWKEWRVIKEFSSEPSVTFTQPKMGDYKIYVDINDGFSEQVTRSGSLSVKTKWSFSKLSVDKPQITIGDKFKVTTTPSGDTDGVTYKFVWARNDWKEWGVIYKGQSNSTEFVPDKPGDYLIYADMIDTYGNEMSKHLTYRVMPDWKYDALKVSSTDVKSGTVVKITPNVSGNTQGLKYKYVYSYFDWKNWGVIKDYSSTTTMDFKVELPGHYDIYVDIKDKYGYVETQKIRVIVDGGMIKVQNLDWYSVVNDALPRGGVYTVVDVWTGKRFKILRKMGSKHADVEPLTLADTMIFKEIYGGRWSWDRRPVIVINGLNAYAGSSNGMPHDSQTITDNGFSGHFCIHFLNSRTHGSNRVDPDHKKAIAIAASVGMVTLK